MGWKQKSFLTNVWPPQIAFDSFSILQFRFLSVSLLQLFFRLLFLLTSLYLFWLFFPYLPHNNSRPKLPYSKYSRTIDNTTQQPTLPQHRVPYGKATTSNSRHIKHPQFITIKKEKRGSILPILPLILVSSLCRATLVLHVPPCLSVYTSRIKYILYGCRDGSHRYTKVRIFRRKRWQRIEKGRKSL